MQVCVKDSRVDSESELLIDPLPTDFITRFGILVPNTNYPPGIDYRHDAWEMAYIGDTDVRMVFIDFVSC